MPEPAAARAGAILTVDLGAVVDNWRRLRGRGGAAECGAVVKADAYGLGAAQVAPALAAAGARSFFVAHLDEALALRPVLPADARLFILNGLPPGAEDAALGLIPVLNSLPQIEAWSALGARLGRRLPAAVQVDSGMARLGLSPAELAQAADGLAGVAVALAMSHLACADTPEHPANALQLKRFAAARGALPPAPASLANSSGVFLGEAFHFDLTRPGAALYGVAPVPGRPNPMRPVVRLQARIAQVRDIAAGEAVGYGWSWTAPSPSRIATISLGYADGWPRALGGRGCAWLGAVALPVVGRISMDSMTLDASRAPPDALRPGALVDLLSPTQGVDAIAALAGTIGYEILTGLGARFARTYTPPLDATQAAIRGA